MILARKWRTPKTMVVLFCIEFPFTVAALTLFALAQPDTYRKLLWQDGYDNGFNSSPDEILYAYANHDRGSLKIPMVWSPFITDWNVVISVLSMFILLAKVVMYQMHIFVPLLSVVTHTALVICYAVSTYGQSGPDTTDPKQPQPGSPWYITKSCSVVHTKSNYGYCEQAKACFAVTIIMLSLFAIYLILAIWSSIPSKAERMARKTDEDVPVYTPEFYPTSQKQQWDKRGSPIAMSASTSSMKGLPFRERFPEH
ncbi:hypothetical protein BDV97DRAFT_116678 [Delphinella strobiligena]|nr:hypothetical protein BDV97DRAFT_116678 [Delphinella strobiligena]